MEIQESFPTFWYSTQGKNPTQAAPDLIFPSSLQSVHNCSFQQPIILQKAIAPKPWIRCGQLNNCLKAGGDFYLFSIRLPVKFEIE
jgi:hypothetical protein